MAKKKAQKLLEEQKEKWGEEEQSNEQPVQYNERRRGIIYRWFGSRSYGFATDLFDSFFVHRSSFVEPPDRVYTGQVIEFIVQDSDNGMRPNALEVSVLEGPYSYEFWPNRFTRNRNKEGE